MRTRGFTTIELILVIILMGLVVAMSIPALVAGFRAFSQQREATNIERQSMLALERMTREIRLGSNIVVSGSSITFERGGVSREIGYDGGGNRLYLGQGGSGQTLAMDVTGAGFGEEAHEDARYINIQFSVAGSTHGWRSSIYPRNDQ